VGAHVKALHVLCIRKATSEEEGDRLISTWVEELLEQAGMVLDSYISMINDSTASQNKDSFGTPKSDKIRKKAAEKSHERNSSAEVANSASQIIPAIFTIGALVLICPKTKIDSLSTIVRALITSIGKQLNCEDALLNNEINAGVHAQAWVTLGKMCLANYELAKTCVPLFLQVVFHT
jgi:condensin-2 complex subunit D3